MPVKRGKGEEMANPKYYNSWTTKADRVQHQLMGVIFDQLDAGYNFDDPTVNKLLNGKRTTSKELVELCKSHDCLHSFVNKVRS